MTILIGILKTDLSKLLRYRDLSLRNANKLLDESNAAEDRYNEHVEAIERLKAIICALEAE